MSVARSDPQYDLLANEIEPYLFGNRIQSTALLAWILEAVWRLGPEDVTLAICDGGGDKGIDALVVDEDLKEITVFQSKHRNAPTVTQGDSELKTFMGVHAYFANGEGIESLLASHPNAELERLLRRHDVREKVAEGHYSVRLVFVTNGILDAAGKSYLATISSQLSVLEVWDRTRLSGVAERTRSPALLDETVRLNAESGIIVEPLASGATLAIAMISGPALVRLPGIEDLTIFDLNVRLSMGKTRINKELAATVRGPDEHELFAAYHNGLTLLTNELEVGDYELTLHGVSVVNGCQSLLALHNNRTSLTPKLHLLVKIVQLGEQIDLIDKITYRTNNQNPVNIRDQRSTDPIQRDLQAQVKRLYDGELASIFREAR